MREWESKCAYAPCKKVLKGWDCYLDDTHGPTGCCSEVCFLRRQLEFSALRESRMKDENAQAIKQFRDVIRVLFHYSDCYDHYDGVPRRMAKWVYLRCAYLAHPFVQEWSNGPADVGSYYGETFR